MEFCTNHQFLHDIWLFQSSSLHLQVHYTFVYALSCMYYDVCVVMVVAVRGGQLYFSKKFLFLVKVFLIFSLKS